MTVFTNKIEAQFVRKYLLTTTKTLLGMFLFFLVAAAVFVAIFVSAYNSNDGKLQTITLAVSVMMLFLGLCMLVVAIKVYSGLKKDVRRFSSGNTDTVEADYEGIRITENDEDKNEQYLRKELISLITVLDGYYILSLHTGGTLFIHPIQFTEGTELDLVNILYSAGVQVRQIGKKRG